MKQEAIENLLNMLYPNKAYNEFLMRKRDDTEKNAIMDTITEFINNMFQEKSIWEISETNMKIFKASITADNSEGTLKLYEVAYKLQIPKNEIGDIINNVKTTIEKRIFQRKTEYLKRELIMNEDIKELNLSPKAENILIRMKKTTLGELIKIRTTDLDPFSNNEKAKKEIIQKIHSLDLIFSDEDTRTPSEKLRDKYNIKKQEVEQYTQELAYINKKRSIALEELDAIMEEIRREEKHSKTI